MDGGILTQLGIAALALMILSGACLFAAIWLDARASREEMSRSMRRAEKSVIEAVYRTERRDFLERMQREFKE